MTARSVSWIEFDGEYDIVHTCAYTDGKYTVTRAAGQHTERDGYTVADPDPCVEVLETRPAARFRSDTFRRFVDQARASYIEPEEGDEDE